MVSDFIFGVRDGVAALLAGQDLEMPFRMVFAGCLPEAVADGRVPMQCVDEAVLRLLQVQLGVPPGTYPASLRSCEAHRALAREAATNSIVLLRNEGQVLPFTGLTSLAVIGSLASMANLGDRGSSDTRPLPGAVLTPLEGLRAAAPDLRIEQASGSSPQAAAELAAHCDAAVVVAGLDWRLEGEHIHPGDIAPILRLVPPPDWMVRLLGRRRLMPQWRPVANLLAWITSFASARQGGDFAAGDRTDLTLPADQVALIRQVAAANPRTVVVLMGGGAMLIEDWRQLVPGLLMLWYPGEQGGAALADVLLGRVSPSGRLPFSVPSQASHLPPFEPRAPVVVYDLWHGYRRLQRDGHPAAFPFGFGLSYSQFMASDLTAEIQRADGRMTQLQACVTITNTGDMEAAEVVQLYLEPPAREVERPARTLVAFERLLLAAGEARRITLAIQLRACATFDPAQDGFVTEEGVHRVVVARHVEDEGLAVALELDAELVCR